MSSIKYNNGVFSDSVVVDALIMTGQVDFPESYKYTSNEYSFNAGGGAFICHETSKFSIRVYFAVGHSTIYKPKEFTTSNEDVYVKSGAVFFSGRAWITHAGSGITLQGEVTNTVKNSRPYFGVTLSKAFDLSNATKLFGPLSSSK